MGFIRESGGNRTRARYPAWPREIRTGKIDSPKRQEGEGGDASHPRVKQRAGRTFAYNSGDGDDDDDDGAGTFSSPLSPPPLSDSPPPRLRTSRRRSLAIIASVRYGRCFFPSTCTFLSLSVPLASFSRSPLATVLSVFPGAQFEFIFAASRRPSLLKPA